MNGLTAPSFGLDATPADGGRPAVWPAASMRVWARVWLPAFALLHGGYALLGKGFAFLPYPPLFVGELTLAAGLPVLLLSRRWRALLNLPTVMLIAALGVWCVLRTLPYVGSHGVDALRDAAIYYYAGYAVIVAALFMDQPELLPRLLGWFDRYAWWAVPVIPGVYLAQVALGGGAPMWPGLGVPVLGVKAGDPMVFAAAVAAFTIVGLGRPRGVIWFAPMAALVAIHGTISRGGLIAFALAFGFALSFFPRAGWPWRGVALALVLMTALVAVNPTFRMPGREREFSVRQFVLNVYSTFGSTDAGDLDDTKTWRLDWWGTIAGYTLGGEHFWGGKGFGVNLADSDGFQVFEDHSLRSPHNGHMTILARSGVPGAALWALLHGSWACTVALGYLRARGHGSRAWPRYFIWVAAAYLAAMFHASFDVYLENPMGGVWVWSFVGLGLAGAYLAPRHPWLLEPTGRVAAPHVSRTVDTEGV